MPSDESHETPYVPRSCGTELPHWLERKRNIDRIVYALWAIAIALLLIDPLIHKHGKFAIEHLYGFYGIYSALACVVAVLVARVLRGLVKRPEDYYDR